MSAGGNAGLRQLDLSPWFSERPRARLGEARSQFVLVVDENIAPLITLVYLLNNHGLPACGAGSLREALAKLRSGKNAVGALLVSTSLIRTEEPAVLRAVRSEFPDCPVIAVADSPRVDLAQQSEYFAYVERPFRVAQLLEPVREALRQTPAERNRT